MWVRSCVTCRQSEVRPCTKSPYQHYPLTSEHLPEIYLDLIEPLPESEGNRYILMCVDRFTRWFTAIALPRQDVQTVLPTCWLTSPNSPYAAPRHCPLVMFLVLHETIVVLLLHRASV